MQVSDVDSFFRRIPLWRSTENIRQDVLFTFLHLIAGISGKSQILFAITYVARYLDLFTTFVSLYNTMMKMIFISASLATLYLMYMKFKATYDSNHDSFQIVYLLVPTAILALVVNHEFSVLEVSLHRWHTHAFNTFTDWAKNQWLKVTKNGKFMHRLSLPGRD